jgi:hypothetical protein
MDQRGTDPELTEIVQKVEAKRVFFPSVLDDLWVWRLSFNQMEDLAKKNAV